MIESSNAWTRRVMMTLTLSQTLHSSYLVHLFPLGRVCVVDVFGGEGLRADPQYGIGVRQASHDPFHVVVLGC